MTTEEILLALVSVVSSLEALSFGLEPFLFGLAGGLCAGFIVYALLS